MTNALHSAFERLERVLLDADAEGAERAMNEVVAMIQQTPPPVVEPRTRVLAERCELLAQSLKQAIEENIKSSASSSRAAAAYGRGGGGG